MFGPGLSLLLLSIVYASSNSFLLSFILINFAFFTRGFEVAGSTLNPTDLAPSFSGVLYGMMNTLASLAGNNYCYVCKCVLVFIILCHSHFFNLQVL